MPSSLRTGTFYPGPQFLLAAMLVILTLTTGCATTQRGNPDDEYLAAAAARREQAEHPADYPGWAQALSVPLTFFNHYSN
jgi:hypothetical protein